MAESTIIDIQIPKSSIDKATKAIIDNKNAIDDLKKANKELEAQGKKNSAEYVANATDIKVLSAEARENERVLIANTKAQKANTGSIKQMKEQLKIVSKEWDNLTKEEIENTEEGKKLNKQKTELTETLKELEGATGDNRRNVGNYTEGMREALVASGQFEKGQKALAVAQKAYTVVMGTSTTATRVFTAALAATGIGAIVAILGTLYSALQRSEEGTGKLSKIFNAFKPIINAVLSALEPLANFVADYIIKYFETLGSTFEWVMEKIADGLALLGFDAAAESVDNFNESLKEQAAIQDELEKKQLEYNKALREQEKLQLDSQNRAEKLRQIRDDESKSISERIKANRDLGDSLTEQAEREKELAQQGIDLARLRIAADGETKENLDALAEAQLKISEIEERITGQRSEQLTAENALLKEQRENIAAKAAETKAAEEAEIEEREAAAEAKASAEEESRQKAIEEREEAFQEELARLEEEAQDKLNLLKEELLEGKILREEYQEEIDSLELASLELRKVAYEEYGESVVDIDSQILDAKLKNLDKEQKAEEAMTRIKKAEEAAKLQSVQNTIGNSLKLLGEHTAAYKILASAQALIDTYTSANAAYNSVASVPYVGPLLGVAAAASAIALGLANVAQINGISTPAFATGVIGLNGSGTETSDSIPARLSKGESVMTAKATKAFAPQLAQMEMAVGNTPNYQFGNGRFATGFINTEANANSISARNADQQIINQTEALSNVTIITQISDINRVQEEEEQAVNRATIN